MNASVMRVAATASPSPLTHVSLVHMEQRITLALRFGTPDHVMRLDAHRRVAVFRPGSIFCRIAWRADVGGAAKRQLMVMQACASFDGTRRVPGVQPGARVLLIADRLRPIRTVLARIDVIEALGIEPGAASPLYWLALDHRLARRLPLPAYTAEQHALWRAGRGER